MIKMSEFFDKVKHEAEVVLTELLAEALGVKEA